MFFIIFGLPKKDPSRGPSGEALSKRQAGQGVLLEAHIVYEDGLIGTPRRDQKQDHIPGATARPGPARPHPPGPAPGELYGTDI